MSTTANALLLPTPAGLVPLDLLPDTALLPTFQANDRTKPESIQSDYSPEFEVPGTTRNHALLRHAAASQPVAGAAYARLPCVLTSGGVEVLPRGILLVKGYTEGRYQLQVLGGNRRFVEALGDKTLADLDFSRFNHFWTPANILARLTYAHWQQQGYGYEVFDRGKPIDFQQVDPYTLYPSVSYRLVLAQLLADAGFTATDLLATEPLLAALNVPAPNPYAFSQPFRDARALRAGLAYVPITQFDTSDFDELHSAGIGRLQAFAPERLQFGYVSRAPFHIPDLGTASYVGGRFTADVLGNYDLAASVTLRFGCETGGIYIGRVRCKLQLRINGQTTYDATGSPGSDELEISGYQTHTFTPKLSNMLLAPGDYVELWWEGKEYNGPTRPYWQIGPYGAQTVLVARPPGTRDGLNLANEVQFTVTLLEEFPQGGLVQLGDWLPAMKQLDFFKSAMLLLGLTVQADPYRDHLHLSPGDRLLSPAHVAKAQDWTRKRDAYAPPGRLPERSLAFRFGSYGQVNTLSWEADERVTAGYGNGTIAVADQVLPASYELAKLPYAATEPSPDVPGLLRIANFEKKDVTATDYTTAEAKPRLVLRSADQVVSGQLVLVPEYTDQQGTVHPAQLAAFTTTASYFAGVGLSLELNSTVLGDYWQDLRTMLDESRYLVERYRLTPQDVAELDYSVPIWDGLLGDYFAVSAVTEYSATRPVEVTLCRLNATYLPPPVAPGGGLTEWWSDEWFAGEWY